MVQNNGATPGISEIDFIDLSNDPETVDGTLGKCKNKVTNSSKKKGQRTRRMLRRKNSAVNSSLRVFRALRSFSQEHSIEKPNDDSINVVPPKIRRRRPKKRKKKIHADEYSRLRKYLKYLLNRIRYERNVIDVCSGEGWNRQSSDKIKLEKELERAKSDVFRNKLKIRNTFERIYSLCSKGKLPESLFDSDGQIDSEDIFCAECFSKELSLKNDIVLCDGVCDRGFHQFCLNPPMFKIPTSDDGWLCPGCDCKIDCFDILNDYEGTHLSVDDSWEMVFPETTSMMPLGDNLELPSDDSDDNDYDPDAPKVDEGDSGEEESAAASSSSDFTSASDDFEIVEKDEKITGISSDDSEDYNYDPDAPEVDEKMKPESSKSDFTSDSEDINAIFEDGENVGTSLLDHGKNHCVSDIDCFVVDGHGEVDAGMLLREYGSIDEGDSVPTSQKRLVERLDYKKLYDETYGNVSSSSSDDEDWSSADYSAVRNAAKKASPKSPNVDSVEPFESMCNKMSPPTVTREDSSAGQGSSINGVKKRKRLPKPISQELARYVTETLYPDKQKKKQIAEHLGITVEQVKKWFESYRSRIRSREVKIVAEDNTAKQETEPVVSAAASTPNSRKRRAKKKNDEEIMKMGTPPLPNSTPKKTSPDQSETKKSPSHHKKISKTEDGDG